MYEALSSSLLQDKGYPAFHTFRDRDNFKEDLIYRHLNPPRAFMIEIGRYSVYSLYWYQVQILTLKRCAAG